MRYPALLLLSLFMFATACHANPTLQLWHAHQAHDFIADIVADFSRHSGQKIRVAPFAPAEIKAELLLSAQSEQLPDIIIVPSDFLGLHQELQLRPVNDDWNDPQTMPAARATTIVDHHQWGVPVIQGNHLMLFYNRKYVSEPATTWAQLAAQKAAIEAQGAQLIGWNYNEMYWFVPFLGAFGGWPMAEEKITLNTPAMIEALDYYKSLSSQGLISADCNYDCAQKKFNTGQYAYAINGDWAIVDSRRELGEQFGLALLPMIDSRQLKPMSSTYALAFPKSSADPHKEALLKAFARHVQSAEQQQKIFNKFNLLPINHVVFNSIKASSDAQTAILLQQLEQSRPMPSSSSMAISWQAMAKGYQRLMSGDTAASAAATMQKVADRELTKRGAP